MRRVTPRVACESYFSQGGLVETHKSSKEGGAPLACPPADEVKVIPWREWSDAAFVEAETADKPILLAIGAVWCHWCHVMDQTSYSDPEVIRTIAERYVPIRVDTDRRPDVNARDNLGGWQCECPQRNSFVPLGVWISARYRSCAPCRTSGGFATPNRV
jgi:hypothetical protein